MAAPSSDGLHDASLWRFDDHLVITLGQHDGILLHLASSSNGFSRACKFAEGVSIVVNPQDYLC